ncbi:MAG: S-ribosylhomocysteine lyase [Oscillospiraceae bacterium]|nr:S-ribosylhomocysteine lyase [Oscillospiraceae bacterium]
MEKIESFKIDHTKLQPGFYLSRTDGDIFTYDMRVKKPNTAPLLSNSELHSFEHMFATIIRNSEIKNDVIYFGPMGCQTGFYLLVRGAAHDRVIAAVGKALSDILAYQGEVFGRSAVECGNYMNLSLESAKRVAREYASVFTGLNIYE